MKKETRLLLLIELIWWVVTAIVVAAVLYPIDKAIYVWPFRWWNIAFVIILITLTRYIFLLKHTFLAKQQELKVVGILLMFPTTFIMIRGLNLFLTYVEEKTWEPLTGHLPFEPKLAIESYLWNEMIFFSVGCVIAAPVLAARLFMSIWTLRNRGVV